MRAVDDLRSQMKLVSETVTSLGKVVDGSSIVLSEEIKEDVRNTLATLSKDFKANLEMQIEEKIRLVDTMIAAFDRIKKGPPGFPGNPGKDGREVTSDEIEAMARKVIKEIKKPPTLEEVVASVLKSKKIETFLTQTTQETKKAEKEDQTPELLAKLVLDELEKKGYSMPNMKKIESRFAELRNQISAPYNPPPGSKRGGGDTVVAGTGVIITNTVNGNKQISASGAVATWRTPPETPNGVITVFTVTAEPATVVADGITLFSGQGYTYATLQITFTNPPALYVRYQT